MKRWIQILVKAAIAALFGLALASKLRDPSQLLTPLRDGLGLGQGLASVFFVVTVGALAASAGLLLLRRDNLGLIAAGLFFLVGAIYSVTLSQMGYRGDCGCGVSLAKDSANPLITHAYQNAACAAFALFLGVRRTGTETST